MLQELNAWVVGASLLDGWDKVPFGFWTVVFFVFGAIVGSFLNVCICRMPDGVSVVTPASRCPKCGDRIPWYLNIPILSWIALRGKCRQCKTKISVRYPIVEFMTAILFAGVWMRYGDLGDVAGTLVLTLALGIFCSGLVVASFIDIDHFIIPDAITLGGIAAGFLASLLAPGLHGEEVAYMALQSSFLGIVVGGGIVYAALRIGKALFGRKKYPIESGQRAEFGETGIQIGEDTIPYEDVFYRKTDRVLASATRVELPDRCFWNCDVSLSPEKLVVGSETYNPSEVSRMSLEAPAVVIPREAMGFGDVKFMAAIGAFLGWEATLFSIMASSILGAFAGVGAILIGKQEWSSRIPYGPYIALAAILWIFGGDVWMTRFITTGALF